MNKGIKIGLIIIFFIALFAGIYYTYNILSEKYGSGIIFSTENKTADDVSSSENEKISAPDFKVTDINGNEVKLSDYIGKPIIINFWASWCPPCKNELPDFESLYKEKGEDLQFIMVNLTDGQRETLDTAKNFISGKGYTFPVYFDTEQDAAYNYGISSIPLTLFIDSEGYVVAGHEGQMNEKMIKEGIAMINP